MERTRLYEAWTGFYRVKASEGHELRSMIRAAIQSLERRMRLLGARPDYLYHGFVKRELEAALGMSYGVHKQLLWGLTSVARVGYNKRVEGGNRF